MDSETSDVSAYLHHRSFLVQPPDHNPHEVFGTPQDHYVAILALVYFYSNCTLQHFDPSNISDTFVKDCKLLE